ncbi:response regulator [Roseomonas marmotae]|uniref:histidine kinase n=1 Tax=Roseomonas marmotae TaxID=2768161 RepID=A0ABS3K7T5_9PROT|nr:response regulator [Roseomonas marmotae]MBO1073522.1 response regulator [Roseomonas marmotae]QTI80290.1 response regulator [Roseomonas marmotae]
MASQNSGIRTATLAGAVVLLLMLISGVAAGWWVIRDGIHQRNIVNHTRSVIETLLEAETSLLESMALRNQALSSDDRRQEEAMNAALEHTRRLVASLGRLMQDNPVQARRAAALDEALGQFTIELRNSLLRYWRGEPQNLLMLLREAGAGRRRLMQMSTAMMAEERLLLAARLEDSDRTAGRLVWLFGALLAFGVISGGLCLLALDRHLRSGAERYAALERSQRQTEAANAALARSQQRLQSILDHARDPILLVDARGRIAAANTAAAEQFRLPATALVGRPIHAVVPAYGKRSGEVQGLRPDGSSFPAEISVGQYEDGDGTASVCVLRDVTERRRLEQLKSEFVSTVSHELRTPLTSIRASLGLVVGGVAGEVPEEVRELLEIAHNNSERLVLLVNDILDMEKIESGRLEFRRDRQSARRLLEQAVEANRAYGGQFGVTLGLEAAEDAAVFADAARIQQVLANLLSNAAKFSPKGGAVDVALTADAGNVTFSVRDHGKGIPQEFRSRIFQRFAQADSSDVRQKGGTGLGLSISKAIIEHHGGSIGFEDAEGGGTRFWFTLPRLADPLARLPQSEVPALGQARRRALVVEDNADVALLLTRLLGQQGWDSEVARSADEAFESLDRTHFDALTLDLMLPGEDGLSLFRRLRQRADGRALPVIVISAVAEAGRAALNGDAVGVVDWLDKPIDQSRLRQALRQALHASDRPARILHVEDDQDILRIVSAVMGDEAEMLAARSLAEARAVLARDDAFALVIIDVGLPDGNGLDLLTELRQLPKPPPVLIFSASDYDAGTARHVTASLVKSRTENQELHETIRHLIENLPPAPHPESQS